MDIVTGLMMTAMALYQEAETPLGEVAFMRPYPGGQTGGPLVSTVNEQRDNMIQTMRQSFEMLENQEMNRPHEEHQQVYNAMRDLAEWFYRGRFEDGGNAG